MNENLSSLKSYSEIMKWVKKFIYFTFDPDLKPKESNEFEEIYSISRDNIFNRKINLPRQYIVINSKVNINKHRSNEIIFSK